MNVALVSGKSPFFRSSDGKWLLRDEDDLGSGQWYASDDGRNFFELHYRGGAFTGGREEWSFDEAGKEKRICLVGDTATLDGRTYQRTNAPAGVKKIPIPAIRTQAYLLQVPSSGIVLYVSQDLYHFHYETMRLFMGRLPNLMQIPITNVTRYRDGGTTIIETPKGTLYVPTRFNPKEIATWTPRGGSVIALSPLTASLSFVETEGRAVAEAGA